ncbi:MAG: NADH-quinone oxidoreductase subunit C [Chloroflexales bacterium]|nr:NADH-quinone oxidoreductase subunit C [Chloroflexales bacterium]
MDNPSIRSALEAAFGDAILASNEFRGDLSVSVRPDAIVDAARFLRDNEDFRFNFLENLCGVDYLGREPRFEVVYHLLSHVNRARVCLKVGLPESDPTVPTLTSLWPTANYQEREAYDMFGIVFAGHPSLDRILMPDDWEGYPQRKDVPLGYEEVAFTFNQDQIYAQKVFAKD